MRVLLAIHNAYTDQTSGAAHSMRTIMQWLAQAGHEATALATARFDAATPPNLLAHFEEQGIAPVKSPPVKAFLRSARRAANLGPGRPTFGFTHNDVSVTMLATSARPNTPAERFEADQFMFLLEQRLDEFAPTHLLTYGGHPVVQESMRRARERGALTIFRRALWTKGRVAYTIGRTPMRALLLALACIAGFAPAFAQSTRPASRIVAIGDVHGAYTEYTTALKRAGLIDDQLKWSGGRATLVQTGDYTDRGTDVRKVLDLLMQIEREAKAAGGMALPLLGNHEVMNFLGDWRDVTPEICATFATPKSEQKREETWKQYERLKQGRGEPIPAVYQATREQWMEAHPPGCLEYREAMAPSGTYGRWLRQKDIAGEVAAHLFMHAGLSPARQAPKSIAEVNERARAEITRFDNYRRRLVDKKLALPSFTLQQMLEVGANELRLAVQTLEKAKAENTQPAGNFDVAFLKEAEAMLEIGKWSLLDPEGPLWFRGYAQWEEASTAPQVNALLDQLKLTRIVVGHTVTSDRKIHTRYGGRVVLMDTGMLRRVYEGTPSALEINGNTLKAIYPDGEEVLGQQ